MTPPRTHRHGRAQQRHAVTAIEHAAPMLGAIEQLYALAMDWSPGYSAGQADVKVSGGGQDGSPPPPGTWQRRPVDQLDDAVRALVAACDGLTRLGVDLLHRSTDTGRRTTTALCAGCQRTVACTPGDRLRSGLCNACYHDVRELAAVHPHLDRGEVLLLWAREQGVIGERTG
jgi:hypothetical protein